MEGYFVPAETHELTVAASTQVIKCLQCCGEYLLAKKKFGADADLPEIHDMVTWAPSWQSTTMMGQMIVAAVPLPTCLDHMESKEKTAQQRAMEGGILLPGAGEAG
jgi:hypothetical protein